MSAQARVGPVLLDEKVQKALLNLACTLEQHNLLLTKIEVQVPSGTERIGDLYGVEVHAKVGK